MSGVAFQINAGSITRDVSGKTIYFCCEGCAGYFDVNRAHVAKTRGLPL